jgi:glycosyltransferase involved in cell wall biosynthesis
LLDAFAALRACVPAVKLAIVGGGPCLAELQQRACLLGIFPDCIFEPATPQVAAWLRAMDIFVLPSLSEALSNSLMEAMACGCCVAASRIGGNPELVIHGETGMLFTPRDVTELAEVLRLLAGAKALRDRLASNAVHLIESRFSLEAAARRMAEIYSSLLA